MATFVKSWEGPGTRVGGLFGSQASGHEPQLQWTRTQQAAFLIYAWRVIAAAVSKNKSDWAQMLRAEERPELFGPRDDLALYGRASLFTTDPGVRGALSVTNDLCWVRSSELRLAEWRAPDEATATDQKAVTNAMASLGKLSVADFLEGIAVGLAKYDWRTSIAPGLTPTQERAKRALRGSGGYKQLREDLLLQLAKEKGQVGAAAVAVRQLLGYA